MSAKSGVGASKNDLGPSKNTLEPSKSEVGASKTGVEAPKILTTGRWMCRKCLSYVRPETKMCRCGGESFTLEYYPEALSEAFQRDAERIKTQMERRKEQHGC